MVDRTPQAFGGVPDGLTDSAGAIQAAIDAAQPGDRLILSGGTFAIGSGLLVAGDEITLAGDGGIAALAGFSGATLIEILGQGVVIDGDGLELDQADAIGNGVSLLATGAPGLDVRGLVSRGTSRAFLQLADATSDAVVAECDHQGEGFGILASDPSGLARLTIRNCRFVHPGTGNQGDGIHIACPSVGGSDVSVVGCTAEGYVGTASGQGMGFFFARIVGGRLIGCSAQSCEGDGFHFEHGCAEWICGDLRAFDVGLASPAGSNGSGLVAYDSDDIVVALMVARNCGHHGIALSGEGRNGLAEQLRAGGRILRCTVDTTGRDGIHLTAQRDFQVDRNLIRDPSKGNPGNFAGIHVGRQGGTSLESRNGAGQGNTVIETGATSPLGAIVVRPQSLDVAIDGVSGQSSIGEPFADGTFFTDGTGWLDAPAT